MMVLRNHDALSRRRMAAMQDPVTGVYQYGQRFQGVRNAPLPCFRYATARLTGFEKMLGRTDETLTYYLCGYGLTPGESLVSLVGETAERFSYVASQALLGDRVVRASYADLVRDCEANGDRLCPLSLVNVVYDPGTPHWVEETDELTWLRMTSASDTSRCVLIPPADGAPLFERALRRRAAHPALRRLDRNGLPRDLRACAGELPHRSRLRAGACSR